MTTKASQRPSGVEGLTILGTGRRGYTIHHEATCVLSDPELWS